MRRVGYRRIFTNTIAAAALLSGCAAQKPVTKRPVVLVEPVLPRGIEVSASEDFFMPSRLSGRRVEAIFSSGDTVYFAGRFGDKCQYSERRTLTVADIRASHVELELQIDRYDDKTDACARDTETRRLRINFDDTLSTEGDMRAISESGLPDGVMNIDEAGKGKVRFVYYVEPAGGPCALE